MDPIVKTSTYSESNKPALKRAGFGLRDYIGTLERIVKGTRLFWGEVFLDPDIKRARAFERWTGLVIAMLLILSEAVAGGSFSWTLVLVGGGLIIVLPLIMPVLTLLWAFFLRTSALLLGESIPDQVAARSTSYSVAGLIPLALGGPVFSWLALAFLYLQTIALERGMRCSMVRALILSLFPIAIALLFFLFFTFMFEVF